MNFQTKTQNTRPSQSHRESIIHPRLWKCGSDENSNRRRALLLRFLCFCSDTRKVSEQVSRGGSSLSHGVKTDQPWLTGPHTAHQHHLMVVEVNKSQYSYKNLFLKHKLVSFLVVLTSWAMLTARLVVIYMVCKLDKTFTQYYVNLTQLCEIFSRCLDMNHRHITLISRVRRSYRVQITWLTYKSVMKNSAAITAVHFLRWFGWFIRTSSVFFFFLNLYSNFDQFSSVQNVRSGCVGEKKVSMCPNDVGFQGHHLYSD